MEDTIRICRVDRQAWQSLIKDFSLEEIQDVLEVVNAQGQTIGTICAFQSGQCYINGHPETDYANLQAAATALMKGEVD